MMKKKMEEKELEMMAMKTIITSMHSSTTMRINPSTVRGRAFGASQSRALHLPSP